MYWDCTTCMALLLKAAIRKCTFVWFELEVRAMIMVSVDITRIVGTACSLFAYSIRYSMHLLICILLCVSILAQLQYAVSEEGKQTWCVKKDVGRNKLLVATIARQKQMNGAVQKDERQ